MGNKYKSKLQKKGQDLSGVYSKKRQREQEKYETSATRKTKGIDELQGENKENRGRKKKDAPRGNTKTSKKGRK